MQGTTKSALVADDDEDVRALVATILTADGWLVETAPDGDLVHDAALDRQPAIVVLDVQMPSRTGLDACRDLRADPMTADCAVFLISAQSSSEHAAAGGAAGCDFFLGKPFSKSMLIAAVDEALARRGMQSHTIVTARDERLAPRTFTVSTIGVHTVRPGPQHQGGARFLDRWRVPSRARRMIKRGPGESDGVAS